jgi:ABC-type transport system involved in multi-copper enzyme maturation permease subunit
MKFLAILRDSVREAMDGKIITALLIGSVIVILAALSISFRAEAGDEGLKSILKRLPGNAIGTEGGIKYSLEDFEQLQPNKPAWQSDYRYTLVVTEPEPPGTGKDDDEAKNKPTRHPSPFKLVVRFTLLQEKSEAELTDEDRQTQQLLRQMAVDLLRSGGRLDRKKAEEFNQNFNREADRVTDQQMYQFLKKQLATSGSLEVTEIELAGHKDREYRFRVLSQARPDTVRTWPHEMRLFFGAVKWPTQVGVGGTVYFIEDWIIAGFGASIALLLGTVITAFFIPNMLRKWTADLLISKPIHRWTLLLYKYVGGMSFMFIPTVVIIVGIWVAMGLRTGLWGGHFLLSIPVLVLQFAIFYAISTLLAVLTRSPIICILACCAAWALLWGVAAVQGVVKPFHDLELTPKWVYSSLDTTRQVLPRYKDLDALNAQLIAKDLLPADDNLRKAIDKNVASINWGASLTVTFVYIGVMLALACWRFSVKDY